MEEDYQVDTSTTASQSQTEQVLDDPVKEADYYDSLDRNNNVNLIPVQDI